MVNLSVITKRVEQFEKHLERIRSFASLCHEVFLKDNVAQDIEEGLNLQKFGAQAK